MNIATVLLTIFIILVIGLVIFALITVMVKSRIRTVPYTMMKNGQVSTTQDGITVSCKSDTNESRAVIDVPNKNVQLFHKNGSYQTAQWYSEKGDMLYIC